MSKLQDLVSQLKAKQRGDQWMARCPAHDDKTPSLSIRAGSNGRILIKCFAGCETGAVLNAVGREWTDIFDDSTVTRPRSSKPRTGSTLEAAIASILATLPTGSRHVRTFHYQSTAGDPSLAVARFEDGVGGKTFRPFRPQDGRWSIGDPPGPLPLYRLSELVTGDPVFVVEGEGCADVARELGLTATTSPHGAKSAVRADWSPLAGKRVVILPDNDAPGRQYANDVEKILRELDRPASVVRLDLAGLGLGEDIADHVRRRRAAGARDEETRDEILALARSATQASSSPTERSTELFKPFPLEGFPATLREFIVAHATADCVDPAFLGVPMLSCLAGAIGNGAEIELKPNWVEPPVLWTAIVGSSGSRKSVALRRVQEPVDALQRIEDRAHDRSMRERALAEVADQGNGRRRARSPEGGAPPTNESRAPVRRRYVVQDTTTEALAKILAEQPHGLLILCEELSGWVRSFNQYKARGGADEAFWLSLYGATAIRVERKTGETSISADRPAVSLTGSIQPGVLRRVFSRHQESGLLARVLFAYPPPVRAVWNETVPARGTDEGFARIVQRLSEVTPRRAPSGDGVTPKRLNLSAGAQALFKDFYETIAWTIETLDEGAAAAFSKLTGACGRIAFVLELAAWADAEVPGEMPSAVSERAMRGAIELSLWFGDEAIRVQRVLAGRRNSDDIASLVSMIRERGGTTTVREWQRRRSKRTAADAQAELQRLVDAGVAAWDKTDARGSMALGLIEREPTAAAPGSEPVCVSVSDLSVVSETSSELTTRGQGSASSAHPPTPTSDSTGATTDRDGTGDLSGGLNP